MPNDIVSDKKNENKRIAKNTLFMYFRMFVIMGIGLYTSRLILKLLGVDDYGLYNVIGGIIAMLGFLNGAMVNTTSRFITFYLGKNDKEKLQHVFAMSFIIHALIAIIIVFLGETLGIWYLYNKLVVPPNRFDAAFWLYQLSILSAVVNILYVPYNAVIVAHEKMKAFAYISIFDCILKLLIVLSLWIYPFDKLIYYGFMISLISLINIAVYYNYCKKNFDESRISLVWNKTLFREMLGFAGWSMMGNFSYLFYSQGINLILNSFCGTAVNAARGIAVQVETIVRQFASNVQTSINPQIIKSYSDNDLDRMFSLIFASSRYCFYLLFLLSLPILMETEFLLSIWLEEVPDHTVNFVRIILCTTLLDSLSNPMFTANLASGKVKVYHITISCISYTFMPITYFALKYYKIPEIVFVCLFITQIFGVIARLFIIRYQIQLPIRDYCINVFKPIFLVLFSSIALPLLFLYNNDEGWIRFGATSFLSVFSVLTFALLLGIKKDERLVLIEKVKRIINK